MTEYVVLSKREAGQWDVEHTGIEANSARLAIKAIEPVETGVYIAVPKRSWQEVLVTVEAVTTIKLSI